MRRSKSHGDSHDSQSQLMPKHEPRAPTAPPRLQRNITPALRERAKTLASLLAQPVHGSTVGTFRVLFGTCMLWQASIFSGIFDTLSKSYVRYPYAGFGWLPTISPAVGSGLLTLLAIAGIAVCVGWRTRFFNVLLTLAFTTCFVHDAQFFNNHYILICWACFLTSFTDWGAWGSVDALQRAYSRWRTVAVSTEETEALKSDDATTRHPAPMPAGYVPYWQLLALQFLFSVPYTYGAIAKLNEDWLYHAQPLVMWFQKEELASSVPLGLGFTKWYPWFIAYTGILFDASIVPLLFCHRARPLAFAGAITFNCMNKLMFNIGVFPVTMLATLVLFLPPDAPMAAVAWLIRCARRGSCWSPPHPGPVWHAWFLLPVSIGVSPDFSTQPTQPLYSRSESRLSWRELRLLAGLATFTAFHLLWPLRHFVLYPPHPSWHEEGHYHAWHMKLRSKRGWTVLGAVDTNGSISYYLPEPHMNSRQKRLMAHPYHMLSVATAISRLHTLTGRKLAALHAHSCYTLNGRPRGKLYNESANLLDEFGKYGSLWSPTAVGRWVYPAPPWSSRSGQPVYPCGPRPVDFVLAARNVKTIVELANISKVHGRGLVWHPPGGKAPVAAYTLDLFRSD